MDDAAQAQADEDAAWAAWKVRRAAAVAKGGWPAAEAIYIEGFIDGLRQARSSLRARV